MKKNEKDMNKCSVESECSIIDNFIPTTSTNNIDRNPRYILMLLQVLASLMAHVSIALKTCRQL
jgi:hypothetical protein